MTWIDITLRLREETTGLATGCMISSSEFNLDDAMSAIELMEPKMDPGFLQRDETELLKRAQNHVRCKILSSSVKHRVCDILIGELMNWLSGQLYLQTVHASLFVSMRADLGDTDLMSFIDQLLSSCRRVRKFMHSSGLSDEEDFVGHMFGLNEESTEEIRQCSPQIVENGMGKHSRFLLLVDDLISRKSDSSTALDYCLVDLLRAAEDLKISSTEIRLTQEDEEVVTSSLNRSLHRNLLPPGPPRVIPDPRSSVQIYEDWIRLIQGIQECSTSIDACISPLALITKLSQIRKNSVFPSAFLRAFLFLRTMSIFPTESIIEDWLFSFCGGNLTGFTNSFKEETEAFVSDSSLVMNRAIYALFRSPCRQHRCLKSVLTDFSVLQHRAWNLNCKYNGSDQKFNSKGLWMFACLLACMLVELNLLLTIELNLVDAKSQELPLIFFLMETAASVRVYLLNDLLGILRTMKALKLPIAEELRKETIVAATEQAFIDCAFKATAAFFNASPDRTRLSDTDLERVFELRSIPIQAFPLPKNVSMDEFLEKLNGVSSLDIGADEALGWIDRLTELIGTAEGIILGTDMSLVKKTVLNNKLMLLKMTEKAKLDHKYHWIVPCIIP
jgi:hypothetical protein